MLSNFTLNAASCNPLENAMKVGSPGVFGSGPVVPMSEIDTAIWLGGA